MRISRLVFTELVPAAFLFFAGIASAQETNFPTGPQYLMTSGSPLFARSLATPGLSLGERSAPSPFREAAAASTSIDGATASTIDMKRETALVSIYYGVPARESTVEISFRDAAGQDFDALPLSILELGVTEMVDAKALKLRGIGVTLPEAAAYWKAHKAGTAHSYTNADIDRLRAKEKS